MSVVISKTCQNCHFWQSRPGVYEDLGMNGECRKRSPGHLSIDGRLGRGAAMLVSFPPTAKTDWCGEFDYDGMVRYPE
jgi:hypothetical protein